MVECAAGARVVRALVLAALLLPAAAHAQYRRAPADTLHYREVTVASSELSAPSGALVAGSQHDARIAVVFAAGDTARAWYDSLSISSRLRGETISPDTRPVLGKPFVLRFDARGDVETLSVPEWPESFEGVSDLTHQFNDFFVKLPATLRPGLEWADTARRERTNARGTMLRTTRTGRFRVRGDTTVAGVHAWVIETRMRNRLESTGPAQGLTMVSTMEGDEEGTLLFSSERGVMVGRRRTGVLAGQVEFTGGPQPVRVPHRMSYTSQIDLLPPGKATR